MPFEMTWEGNGVYKQFSGFVSGAELVKSVESVTGDHRFKQISYVINDYTEMVGNSFDASATEYVHVIRFGATSMKPAFKVAYILRDEEVIAAIKKYASAGLLPYQWGIFNTLEEARNWIAG